MPLTGPEIRKDIVEKLRQQKPRIEKQPSPEDVAKFREVAEALKEMTLMKGWKLFEEWMTIQMDIGSLLFEEDPKKKEVATIRARVYAEIFLWVEDSVTLLDRQLKEVKNNG